MNVTGRLTRDAEIRTVNENSKVVSFSVAINDGYKNKQGERVQLTEFIDCSYWRTMAVAEFLTKGTLVELTGWMGSRAWIDGEGQPRSALNLRTSEIKFLGGGTKREKQQEPKKNGTGKGRKSAQGEGKKDDDDLPF
jgi:single-strand DNA-binding protein